MQTKTPHEAGWEGGMEKFVGVFKRVMDEIRSDHSLEADVLECCFSLDLEGKLASESQSSIQIRIVAYPQRGRNDSAVN